MRINQAVIDALAASPKKDAGIAFLNELEAMEAQVYRTQYAPRMALTMLPVDTSINEGATSLSWKQFSRTGIAKLLASKGADIPLAGINSIKNVSPILDSGIGYSYSLSEVLSALMTGIALSSEEAEAAFEGFLDLIDKIAWRGDADTNLPGLLSNPNITTGTVANPGSGTTWAVKTSLQIITDLNQGKNAIFTATSGRNNANTLGLPVDQYALAASKPMTGDNPDTVLQFFLKNSPKITTVEPMTELDSAINTDLTSDSMLFFEKNPRNLKLQIPKMLQFQPVQPVGLDFNVPGHGKIGGCVVYKPLTVSLYNGI